MRTVHELTQEELEELQDAYFDQLLDQGDTETLGEIDMPCKIPIANVIAHYDGIMFVDEDFFCNIKDEDE